MFIFVIFNTSASFQFDKMCIYIFLLYLIFISVKKFFLWVSLWYILEWLWSRRCVFSVLCSGLFSTSPSLSSERFGCRRGDLLKMNMSPDAARDWLPAGCQGRSRAVIDDRCAAEEQGVKCATRERKARMRFLTGTEKTLRWCLGYADRTPPAQNLPGYYFCVHTSKNLPRINDIHFVLQGVVVCRSSVA